MKEQIYPVFPNDLNPRGTVFGGRVLEIADSVAGTAATRYNKNPCVTLGLDSVRFLTPARAGELLVFKPIINRTWTTSMEVEIRVFAESFQARKRRLVASMYFTFVGADKNLKPTAVRPFVPKTKKEKERWREADIRRRERLRFEKRLRKHTK